VLDIRSDYTSMNKMHKIHFIFKNFTFTLGHGKVEFENVIKNKGAREK